MKTCRACWHKSAQRFLRLCCVSGSSTLPLSISYKASGECLFCSSSVTGHAAPCYTSTCTMQKRAQPASCHLPSPPQMQKEIRALSGAREGILLSQKMGEEGESSAHKPAGVANRQAVCLSFQQIPLWSDWSCNFRTQSKFG